MKLVRKLAAVENRSRNVLLTGKITALVLVAAIAGCASQPVPKDTLGSQIMGLAYAILNNPNADASKLSAENYAEAMNGFYQKHNGYYLSDTGFNNGTGRNVDFFILHLNKAIIEMCRRKGGDFYAPFCQKYDSAEGVIFYAEASKYRIRESLYTVKEYSNAAAELIIYEKTAEPSPEFAKVIREKLGYKTNEEKRVEEEARKKVAEERRLKVYRSDYEAAMQEKNSISKLSKFVRDYSGKYDPDNLMNVAEKRLSEMKKSIELDSYRKKFNSAVSSVDFKNFINLYEKNDLEGLIPQARSKLKIAELNEAKQQQLEQENRRKEEAAKQAKLEAWRKSIKVGDDTFCGPVIEVRQPMVRIAIKVPLAGYPSETWLKSSELYPDWMAGCRNVNGQIRPMF